MNRKLSIWQKIKAYRLENTVYVLILLVLGVILSLYFYTLPILDDVKFVPEITLAVATSLLATILSLISDVYVKYKSHKNDQFLEGISEFGIRNLHFDKQKLLEDLLETCDKEIWVSGYRLILTKKILKKIIPAVKQGVHVKILVSPPWHPSFKLVYGEHDKVLDNYCAVFQALAQYSSNVKQLCEIRFTPKPLFNDTYKIDMHIVTGPYMHNRDDQHERITANDFFTYDIIKKSKLFHLVENEYSTLWEEAVEVLDWDKFSLVAEKFRTEDLREKEKIELMKDALQRIA